MVKYEMGADYEVFHLKRPIFGVKWNACAKGRSVKSSLLLKMLITIIAGKSSHIIFKFS